MISESFPAGSTDTQAIPANATSIDREATTGDRREQSLQTQGYRQWLTISIGKYWDKIGLLAILMLSAFLNLYQLGAEGYGNTYYAAAIRSMMQSWHNFFFNSFDPGGFVSIDKPPLGFWFQVISAKIFGYNGIALMLPQALAGVLSVALLFYLVSRHFGRTAGLIAALALAVTPISVVSNRNNIVDSTLVLAVLLAAWAVIRAAETGRLRWLLLSAVFVGLGFNIKMLEAYLVVPAIGLMYLLGARIGWRRRIAHLVIAGVVLVGVSLAWVAAVDLTPASQRPWVGSTTNNSELSLAIGYNGLQRLTGNTAVSGGGGLGGSGSAGNYGPGGVGENGPVGWLRLLDSQLGSQIGWLLPLAVIGFFVAAWETRRRLPLTMRQNQLVLWGAWLATTGAFFSIAGFYHTYYLVMVAPAIAALSGIGMVSLWRTYRQPDSRLWPIVPISLLAVAAVEVHILGDYPAWSRWLAPLIIGLAAVGALVLTVLRLRPLRRDGDREKESVTPTRHRISGAWRAFVGVPALLVALAGLVAAPAIWSIESVYAADSGLTPRAGPTGTAVAGFGGGRAGGFQPPAGGYFGPPPGARTGVPRGSGGATGPVGGGFPPPTGGRPVGGGGIPGGLTQIRPALLTYLEKSQGSATFLFATTSARTAEPYIIATGKAVMATGGFTGSDPILTVSKLAALVKSGAVRYFLLDGGGFGGPGGGNSSVTSWVQSTCKSVPSSVYASSGSSSGTTGTLYDCGAVH